MLPFAYLPTYHPYKGGKDTTRGLKGATKGRKGLKRRGKRKGKEKRSLLSVPWDAKAAHGSPAYEYGTQVANLETLLWWI